MRKMKIFALAATLCLVVVGSVKGQGLAGTLRVTVSDKSNASVLDADVRVTNEATNVSTSTTASSAGTYVFPTLTSGLYTITVEKNGFTKYVQKNVQVGSSQITEVKVELTVGSVAAVIEVQAGADLVKTQTSDLDTTFGGRLASDLPINTVGGSVLEFAVFAPGTTTQQGGVAGSGGSVGGTRPRFNGFTIDGVDDNRTDVNGPATPVIQDSVAEFTLIANQFSAEYGHSAGGQFNIVTKSGSNNFHGQAHWYNQNRNYNALDNLQKDRGHQDRFDYNRAGGDFGGPIRRDKLFFFGNYERTDQGGPRIGACSRLSRPFFEKHIQYDEHVAAPHFLDPELRDAKRPTAPADGDHRVRLAAHDRFQRQLDRQVEVTRENGLDPIDHMVAVALVQLL